MKYCAAVVAVEDDKILEQCWTRQPAQSAAEARNTLCLCGVVLTPTYEADTQDAALHVLHKSEYWNVDRWTPPRLTTSPRSR
jgi:hypothetical protein